jgi:proteasome lid subunit RPN8/RPN11
MTLKIRSSCLEAVRAEAEARYPDECCGLLLGLDDGEKGARLAKALSPADNLWEDDNRRRRFKITSEDFLLAEKLAEEKGLEVIGVYHSHPGHPPEPSDYDLSQAWPFYSYLIVGSGETRKLPPKSFRLAPDRSAFLPEELQIES